MSSESMRIGFGRGLVTAGQANDKVVALSADLAESTGFSQFQEAMPGRYIEVGVAEQNLVTVASGLAHVGWRPYVASYAAFSPGRNWEQIRTTIGINNQPVTIVGTHAGLNVGPDGATHQALEDTALMRVMPNMAVISPGDSTEAEQVAISLANYDKPAYVRLAREKTEQFLGSEPFVVGKAKRLREGSDVALIGTGTMTYMLIRAAELLEQRGISAEVLHVPTIKPLDEDAILESAKKCGRVVVAEEAQIAGGFCGAVAELLSEKLPMPVKRIGVDDRYGQTGTAGELLELYGLSFDQIATDITEFINKMPQYHQEDKNGTNN